MNSKWFLSSTGSGDLALTVKSLLVFLLPLVINALRNKYPGFNITEAEIIEGLSAIWATCMLVYGLFRKFRNGVI